MTRVELARPSLSRFLQFQRVDGVTAAYLAVTNQQAYRATSSGPNIGFTVNLPVDSWADVRAVTGILQKTDAAYHYAFTNLWLTTAASDVDGQNRAHTIQTQHSTVNNFGFRHIHRRWKLAANTTYRYDAMFECSGGTWQFYMDAFRNFIEVKSFAR